MNNQKLLLQFHACCEAVEWSLQFQTLQEAWQACPRGDWMLWLAFKLKANIHTITLAKGLCANTVRHLMKDPRSLAAVDAAIAFGKGEIDENSLRCAAAAAVDAAIAFGKGEIDENSLRCAAAAAYAYAAAAAYAYAYAAAAAADAAAAYAAAYAATTTTYAAKKKNQLDTANICREILTEEVFKKLEDFQDD